MSEEIKLLPCPACNDEASILENVIDNPWGGDITVYSVQCIRCGLLTGQYGYKRQVLEHWNAIPRVLRWTNEPPNVPGRYWNRDARHPEEVDIIRVTASKIEQLHKLKLYYPNEQWAGPIPEPKEEEPCQK